MAFKTKQDHSKIHKHMAPYMTKYSGNQELMQISRGITEAGKAKSLEYIFFSKNEDLKMLVWIGRPTKIYSKLLFSKKMILYKLY